MGEKFIVWFENLLCNIKENIKEAIVTVIAFVFGIVTSLIWIIPFIYWYFFKYKRNVTNKNTQTNFDRINSMSIEELAELFEQFGTFNQPCKLSVGEPLKWLQSEVEE